MKTRREVEATKRLVQRVVGLKAKLAKLEQELPKNESAEFIDEILVTGFVWGISTEELTILFTAALPLYKGSQFAEKGAVVKAVLLQELAW